MISTLLLLLFILGVFITFAFIIGEAYSQTNEETKFAKWWRKYICSPDPFDE
jgi:fructose-specific phosphotransferase system IIC component